MADLNMVSDLKSKIFHIIESSKTQLLKNINSSIVLTYWSIGKEIFQEEKKGAARANYGEKLIEELSKELSFKYGKGFSKSNLTRMIKFYITFDNAEIVATLSQQFSWSHFIEFIKIDDSLRREFYITLCHNENWSVRILQKKINSMLFERTAISKKPEKTIENDLKLLKENNFMSPCLFIKDPYILDFLELQETFSEKDLEQRILVELEKFILEFGNDFAFLSRQKRIHIGKKDYYMDLLFYHRKMRRLVLIELKIGEFQPQYKGQVELYLNWLNKYERQQHEEEPIAIILCASKDNHEIELLGLNKDTIHVSEYWLDLPPKKILEEKLHKAIENAKMYGEINNKKED